MKILKMVLKLLALFSLAVLAVTGKVISAVFLLAFSSMSLGIIVGEKISGEKGE